MLDRMTGPACPVCGCPDTTVVSRRGRGFTSPDPDTWPDPGAIRTHVCGNCRHRFVPPPATDPQPLAVQRCPHCHHARTKITSTRGRLRYHKCEGCDLPFRTVAPDDY